MMFFPFESHLDELFFLGVLCVCLKVLFFQAAFPFFAFLALKRETFSGAEIQTSKLLSLESSDSKRRRGKCLPNSDKEDAKKLFKKPL